MSVLDEESCLTTGDLARRCETTVRTVRFYEEAGVLRPGDRTDGGHRVFGRADLMKLQLIMDLREAGLSLNEIRSLFELKRTCGSGEEASTAMRDVLARQLEDMQRKIGVLRRLRDELASTVAVIQECGDCHAEPSAKDCVNCDVMNQSDLPRAVRLLWDCGHDD